MRPVKAIFFDLDNTLFDRRAAARALLTSWAQTHELGEPFVRELMACDDLGYCSREDFCRAWSERARAHGVTWGQGQAWALWQEELAPAAPPDRELVPFLKRLMRQFQVGIISNGGLSTQRRKLEHLHLLSLLPAAHILISQEQGVSKPDTLIFERACARLGRAPRECLHVGDAPVQDIQGAARAGLMTCWVRCERAWDEGLPLAPDLQINHYLELEGFSP